MTASGDADAVMPARWFERLDPAPDSEFYAEPRFVQHIDQATINELSEFYAEIIQPRSRVLDLMSSWVSHLPDALPLSRVSGLGMNAAELAANPRLDDYVVHDLNHDPKLPYDDELFDVVLIAVSVQYLIQPLLVFQDIARVLAPGGRVVVAMSHRCFPNKAIRVFHHASGSQRTDLVAAYIASADEFETAKVVDRSPAGADPLWIVTAQKAL